MTNLIENAKSSLPMTANPSNLGYAVKRSLQKEAEQIIKATMLNVLKEDGHAFLAGKAMHHVANLSAEEALLAKAIPNAEGRLRCIVDNYTVSVAQRILRR
jgi:hypothetical protein